MDIASCLRLFMQAARFAVSRTFTTAGPNIPAQDSSIRTRTIISITFRTVKLSRLIKGESIYYTGFHLGAWIQPLPASDYVPRCGLDCSPQGRESRHPTTPTRYVRHVWPSCK